jgi:hypothetical protein
MSFLRVSWYSFSGSLSKYGVGFIYEELAEKVHIRPDGKRDTQFSEQRITWHLQALLHDWFLKVPTELDWNTVNRSQKDLDTMNAWYRLWANFYDWLWYNDWEKTQNIQKSK